MAEKDQHNRYRCLEKGCNPVMKAESPEAAKALGEAHTKSTGHRTAKWAIRSVTGKAKAKSRNQTGYYDKYNGTKPRPDFMAPSMDSGSNWYNERSPGEAIFVGGEFYGYEDSDDDGEYSFGEDDF